MDRQFGHPLLLMTMPVLLLACALMPAPAPRPVTAPSGATPPIAPLGITPSTTPSAPTPASAATRPPGSTPAPQNPTPRSTSEWQEEFGMAECPLVPTGRNPYFILEPRYQLVLEGGNVRLAITVLDETRQVNGVLTRVVEEKEWSGGQVTEVARNFFAMCEKTKDVFYFGEEVDMYQGGRLVNHSGAWLAGENGARAGLIMSGQPQVGMKYYQELAPGVAMDRAEIIRADGTCKTPAGTFSQCLTTQEGTALNPLEREFKSYAPGIGLVQDASLLLTQCGFAP